MDLWIRRFRQSAPIHKDQPVLIPGDPERAFEAERMQKGIPVPEALLQNLTQLGEKMDISAHFS